MLNRSVEIFPESDETLSIAWVSESRGAIVESLARQLNDAILEIYHHPPSPSEVVTGY